MVTERKELSHFLYPAVILQADICDNKPTPSQDTRLLVFNECHYALV